MGETSKRSGRRVLMGLALLAARLLVALGVAHSGRAAATASGSPSPSPSLSTASSPSSQPASSPTVAPSPTPTTTPGQAAHDRSGAAPPRRFGLPAKLGDQRQGRLSHPAGGDGPPGLERPERDGIAGPKTKARLAKASAPRPRREHLGGRFVEVFRSLGVMLLVDHGKLVRAVHVSTGMPGLATPAGRFAVYLKSPDWWSTRYDVWMPYASFFVGGDAIDGFAPAPRPTPPRTAACACRCPRHRLSTVS